MAASDTALKQQQSIVVVQGIFKTVVVTQEIVVNHLPGTREDFILKAAINTIRSEGGMTMSDGSGGANFYPLLSFDGPLGFSVKKVVLAPANTLLQ